MALRAAQQTGLVQVDVDFGQCGTGDVNLGRIGPFSLERSQGLFSQMLQIHVFFLVPPVYCPPRCARARSAGPPMDTTIGCFLPQ
jgi:hypothetical protein